MSQQQYVPGTPICIEVFTSQPIPSFKNRKRAIKLKNGAMRTLTEPEVKERMDELENGIELALLSLCLTKGEGMDSECLKRLQTALSGLSDDSLNQIPAASFESELSTEGLSGVRITIEEIV